LAFAGDRAAGEEQGGRVFELWKDGRRAAGEAGPGLVEIGFARGAIELARLTPGQQVWKTDDPELTRRLRKSFSGRIAGRPLVVDLVVRAAVGEPLAVSARAANGSTCQVQSDDPLAAATRHPLAVDLLRRQLGRLGGTGFALGELQAEIVGHPMAPLSVLGKLRHALVVALRAAGRGRALRRIAAEPVLPKLRAELPKRGLAAVSPELHVLCRTLRQVEAALACGRRSLIAEFQDIREYGAAVERAHSAGARILLATPRIQKPEEHGLFRVLLRGAADGILARNLAGLAFFARQGVPVVADFALNAANELTAAWLHEHGAERVTPSYDLNREQLLDLVAAVPAEWLEVVIHQHMPMFHMEHCVFCAVLSPGTNKTNCGRPCDRHAVRLRDRVGMEHPLVADVGCRNTLYNAVPQSAAEAVPELLARGVRHFRLELLGDVPEADLAATLDLYQSLLRGERTGREVWTKLRAANRVGVTRGTLEERRNPLAIL
jgi:putative protease